jgi:hypothetical protein
MSSRLYREQGASTGLVITIVLLALLAIAGIGVSVWAYMNYVEQKTNVDAKVEQAVASAEKNQADSDEKKFALREKEPNRDFAGPADYGTLSFKYPKTWSVYVASDGSSSEDFKAYLNPVTVPPISTNLQRFALRVSIVNEKFENVIDGYQSLVQTGKLHASAVKANGETGTRLDGNFSEDIRGAAVIYKIRDKTAIVRTDADTFKPDFENIIKTITFVQ